MNTPPLEIVRAQMLDMGWEAADPTLNEQALLVLQAVGLLLDAQALNRNKDRDDWGCLVLELLDNQWR